MTVRRPHRVLVLYHPDWIHVKSVSDHLESFHQFSRFDVSYASSLSKCVFDLDCFSAVMVHYTARVCHPGHLTSSWLHALQRYQGVKALFLQDEYENVHLTRRAIVDLGMDVVFTCVPIGELAKVYPETLSPSTRFVHVLTGYVPADVDEIPRVPPMQERSILIGYRGRNLGYWYGDLGQEKLEIGRRMKRECDERRLSCDIGWEESDRIYGDHWYRFLCGCRATLGTESGANLFDWDGTLRTAVQRDLLANPSASYEEIRARRFPGREGEVAMGQISPKFFEAIACRTALILFEGTYSGVLTPEKHFIPLRKDFSNVDDVLRKVQNAACLEKMTDQAYEEIVASGRYSYRTFVDLVDCTIEPLLKPAQAPPLCSLPMPTCDALTSFRRAHATNLRPHLLQRAWHALPDGIRRRLEPLLGRTAVKNLWTRAPTPVRAMLQPFVTYARSRLRPGQ